MLTRQFNLDADFHFNRFNFSQEYHSAILAITIIELQRRMCSGQGIHFKGDQGIL